MSNELIFGLLGRRDQDWNITVDELRAECHRLSVWQNQLRQKQTELDNREKNLDQTQLRQNSRGFSQKNFEKSLSKKQRQLQELDNRLDREFRRLQEQEKRLNQKQAQLEEQEARLEQTRIRLREREEHLNEQERILEERQNQVAQLEETIRCYRQERALWEDVIQKKPEPELQNVVGGGLTEVAAQFRTATMCFSNIKSTVNDLVKAICAGDHNTVQAMCEFHRRLELQKGDEFRLEAAFFAGILKKYYQLEPVEPAWNSCFDDSLHERAECNSGQTVVGCISRGWRNSDTVFTKAYVLTSDSEDDNAEDEEI